MAEVGHVLGGRYRLVELLGQGGMATIFRARDTKLGRDVAVKVLRAEYGRTPASWPASAQEAQAAAALNHPNVVAVFDYGMDPVGPYIVMELVAGGDLAAALARARAAASRRPPRASPSRSRTRSTRPTRAASSIATSSPATCC